MKHTQLFKNNYFRRISEGFQHTNFGFWDITERERENHFVL